MSGGPESLSKLLSQLTPLLARDFAPGFRAAFWGDTKVMHLLRRHNAALRSAWAARSCSPMTTARCGPTTTTTPQWLLTSSAFARTGA